MTQTLKDRTVVKHRYKLLCSELSRFMHCYKREECTLQSYITVKYTCVQQLQSTKWKLVSTSPLIMCILCTLEKYQTYRCNFSHVLVEVHT